jgi:hypothetical protein
VNIDSTQLNRDVIPLELRERRQWMTWNLIDGQKIPNGKSNDSSTWKDFAEIEIFDRIAFVIDGGDPYCGIDLDGCIVDGQWLDWVVPILERFAGVAYGEISPSGTGLKLTTKARKPKGSRCKCKIGDNKQQIECYDFGRFWTVTANLQPGYETISDGQAAVDWLCETYLTPGTQATSERRIEAAGDGTNVPLSLLRRAQAYVEKFPQATKGDLRDSAFKNAGHLHAFVGESGERLSVNDVYHLLRSWNGGNNPQLRDDELLEAAQNALKNGTPRADKPPEPKPSFGGVDVSSIVNGDAGGASDAGAKADAGSAQSPFEVIRPISFGKLIDDNPEMRPVVIDGVLRRGETANVVAAAKAGKSFLAGNLAWCIATGEPWLTHDVTKGRVLILDNELHPETLASRLLRIALDMQIDVNEFGDEIDVICLRGQNIDIHSLSIRLAAIQPGEYAFVVVDALYRTLPAGTSENDNAQMMAIYNRLDFYAQQWDCAIAVIHHASKGAQGDKSVTDVGSGAGSISRAADTHIILRPHENPELSVLECVTRSFKSPEPVSVRFDWPLWSAVAVAPEVKRVGRQSQEGQAKADAEATEQLLDKIPVSPKSVQQNKLFEQFPFGVPKCSRLVGKLVQAGDVKIHRRRRKGSKRTYVFYTRTELDSSPSDSNSNSGSDSRTS